ncbi:MAG: RNA pseudouridine synthase, partial [Flammeovirgaceae bacterium]|nr:RNA pseudouridine synthase [Flammeovirgaceae bacterium]
MPTEMNLSDNDILLNDSHLLALNKPQGIMVEKDAFGHASLIDLATEYLSKGAGKKEVFLQNAHRLDRPVSGVVLFAKKPSALKHLQQQFEKKKVQKIYLALTDKRPAEEKGLLNHFHYKDVQHKKAIISSSSSP